MLRIGLREAAALHTRWLADTGGLQLLAARIGLFSNVRGSLDLVAGRADQLQIAFAMRSAITERADMIVLGPQLADDRQRADGAPLVEFQEDAEFDPRRDSLVVVLRDPFGG